MAHQAQITSVERQIQHLRDQLSNLETRLASLRQLAADEEKELGLGFGKAESPRDQSRLHEHASSPSSILKTLPAETLAADVRWPLSNAEYKRYGRQIIMPEVGLRGQLRLKSAAVLIVGAGGLGCPAAAYLAGAGVGKIGLVDADVVEESNLHRQVLHSTARVGWSKVESAINFLAEYVMFCASCTFIIGVMQVLISVKLEPVGRICTPYYQTYP
jgi:adenylyltransferase/sulfurtransferase